MDNEDVRTKISVPSISYAVCLSAIAVLVVGMSVMAFDPIMILIASLLTVIVSGLAVGIVSRFYFQGVNRRVPTVLWFFIAILLVLIFSVPITNWPVRVAFALVQERIDSLADVVQKTGKVETPQRAGPFLILKGEMRAGSIVCLWVDDNPGGPSGFVRASLKDASQNLNLWSYVPINNEWQLVFLD